MGVKCVSHADEIFVEALQTNRKQLVALASRVVGCSWRGEEIVQDAYLRVMRGGGAPEGIQHPLHYLKRVIYRLAIDVRRGLTVERHYAETVTFNDRPATSPDLAANIELLRPDAIEILTPERKMASRDELAHVLECLEDLSEQTRKAFELSQLYGYKQREIGEILGVSTPRVHAMLKTAFQHLSKKLDNE